MISNSVNSPFTRFPPRLRETAAAGLAAFALSFGAAGFGAAAAQPAIPADTLGLAVGLDALRWQDSFDLRDEFADYRAMGVRWLRTDLNWETVQQDGPDSFDWSEMDRIVDTAASFGISVLPVVGSTPEWAWETPEQITPPTDPGAFGRFMSEAVRRYAPRGIHVWEIWNEPNLKGPFPPRPDPAAYAMLLKAAAPAIRAADPQATIILGGLAAASSTDRGGRAMAAAEFLNAVYEAGAGGSFDAVGFHPYTGDDLPDIGARRSSWGMMAGPIRDVMAAHGDQDMRIWITEYGAPTNEEEGGVSEARQAELLASGVRLARETPWIGPLFWYSYRDLGTDPDDAEDWFGLMAEDGRPKPVRDTLERILSE
ncbi:cellulase family glycosylhydrolase [Paracoccus sp. Z118]|uniref:cellulase family glycosylhydrolase n=1 Tax=Paracoccus sp. Z118 TaxID=2851017 RepID=UPI001C2BF06F|nr:cellulase family glycosylhydrolase [Paracoccus sp. Z118]MBV0892977.1 cellulase family glycosylhydrolase [Paracoccus sp. Z118]